MDQHTYETLKENLINGGPLAFVVVQLKLHDYPAAQRHYLAAPLPLLAPLAAPLPPWLRSLVYVDRLDLIMAEQRQGDTSPGAAPADALLYLLSAPPGRLSRWDELRRPAAFAALSRHREWLLDSEIETLHRWLGGPPAQAGPGQWHSLQLLQIMLRQWLLRQAHSRLLLQDNAFEEEYFYAAAPGLPAGMTLRAAAHQRFPAINHIERSNTDVHLTCSPAAAPAAPPPVEAAADSGSPPRP